jgi:hypothetical protein
VGFAVTRRTPVQYEPPVRPLDRPAFRDGGESPGPGGALDDFEVDAEGCGVFDDVLAVAAVDPDLAQGGVVGGGLLQPPRGP